MLKHPHFNKKYLHISFYALLVLVLAIAWSKFLDNPTAAVTTVGTFFSFLGKLISPFFYGFCIAYLMNPLVKKVQSWLFHTKFSPRLDRGLAILFSYLLVFGLLIVLMVLFLPQLLRSLMTFANSLSDLLANLEEKAGNWLDSVSFLDREKLLPILQSAVISINSWVERLIPKLEADLPHTLSAIAAQTLTLVKGFFNGLMSLFISFYMLAEKERCLVRFRQIGYAFFDEKKTDRFFFNMGRVNRIFQGFIVGKTLDSLIIFIICLVGMFIIHAPYALLLSVVVGVTNMIPYFGPIIGAVPCVLITLLISPGKALWVLVFIVALQQFDGNYLGPKILGQSTGLRPLWVILSITVGGSLLGVVGMFIGVPTCASIKLFVDEYIDQRYAKKKAESEMAALAAPPDSPPKE